VQGTEAAADGHTEWRSGWLIGGDPTDGLYFDIVAVARPGDEWTLNSGLCKR
jgi:hypothetical protein